MDKNWNLKLINLLSDASVVENEKMQIAYEDLVTQIKVMNQPEIDCIEIFRMLNNTRIELVFLQTFYRYEQEKKCPEIRLSSESHSVPRI